MSKSLFLIGYLALGGLGVLGYALLDRSGADLPAFGPGGVVDTSSRQGYWYTYKPPPPSSSSGRSPGRSGSSGSGGGYSGGK